VTTNKPLTSPTILSFSHHHQDYSPKLTAKFFDISLSLSPNPNPHTITKNPCHSPNNHFQTPQPQLLLCHALVTKRTKRFRPPRPCREMKSLKPQTLMGCTYACFKPNFLARYGTVLRETEFGGEWRERLMQQGKL